MEQMTKRITLEILRGACEPQRAEFAKRFPKGIVLKSEQDAIDTAVEVAEVFNWAWAAANLLSNGTRKDFERAKAIAWKNYRRIEAAAQKDFERVDTAAWENYKSDTATLWEDYRRVRLAALGDYRRVRTTARENYVRAVATAFARAFWYDYMGEEGG